jgi:ABC-2 type transport system ATP-binding protein
MTYAIEVAQLTKSYASGKRSLAGVSFQVAYGEIFGLLGPNGAGKSTSVRILTTLSLPSSGSATVGGYDVVHQPEEVRRVIGVALQEVGVDPLMTARELLLMQGRLFGLDATAARRRTNELLAVVGLEQVADQAAGTYSGGMRRRLDLALALVHQPAILFLDEPTTGLDPVSRRALWAEIARLNQEMGTTIVLTTQYLEEADALAQRIAILSEGQIVASDSPAALKRGLGTEAIILEFADQPHAVQAALHLAPFTSQIQHDGAALRLYLPDAARAVPGVMSALGEHNLAPQRLTLAQPTLDDVFFHVTSQQLATSSPPAK